MVEGNEIQLCLKKNRDQQLSRLQSAAYVFGWQSLSTLPSLIPQYKHFSGEQYQDN